MDSKDFHVKKRNNRLQELDINKINLCAQRACENLVDVSASEVVIDANVQFYDKIPTKEIDKALIMSARAKIEKEPKQYKIQEVIKKGQILLVQVIKEERGNKGVSLTTFISLAGKYCVLMPNNPYHNGISRKISNSDERKRLKDIISNLTTNREKEASSVIARTAGAGHTTLEIKRDYNYLARLWNKIREATLKSKAPCFIHQEDGILLKTIRDMFDRNVLYNSYKYKMRRI